MPKTVKFRESSCQNREVPRKFMPNFSFIMFPHPCSNGDHLSGIIFWSWWRLFLLSVYSRTSFWQCAVLWTFIRCLSRAVFSLLFAPEPQNSAPNFILRWTPITQLFFELPRVTFQLTSPIHALRSLRKQLQVPDHTAEPITIFA